MLGAAELELVRDGARLINTARAGIIDQEALLRQLRSGRMSAALDVFETEPLPDHSELRRLTNVPLSPHAAGYTVDSYQPATRGSGGRSRAFLARSALDVSDRSRHDVSDRLMVRRRR